MKVAVLGAGTWGFCLANLLASKGVEVVCWGRNHTLIEHLKTEGQHPKLPPKKLGGRVEYTENIDEALADCRCIVEAVTSKGIRETLIHLQKRKPIPLVCTSKGIEIDTGFTLPEIVVDRLNQKWQSYIGVLSGPSYAQEVIQGLPTSVVFASEQSESMLDIAELFTTLSFRVYPNSDIKGVALGGALKNCIAIACGIAEGLRFGNSSKAALMTRGLHEMRKLGHALGCRAETFYGLSGMGDIFLTCSSTMSRNFQFGLLLAQGKSAEQAYREIGMAVEGVNSCLAAQQMSAKYGITLPITESVVRVLQGEEPLESAKALMQRAVKQEHL